MSDREADFMAGGFAMFASGLASFVDPVGGVIGLGAGLAQMCGVPHANDVARVIGGVDGIAHHVVGTAAQAYQDHYSQ